MQFDLKNSLIELSFKMADSNDDSSNALYTDKDKLQFLIKKNENLQILKQELNLDLDK
ncbi:MAG: hypothetical protein U9R54_07290 [Bacteroidota bacterium]|nr:hypothetical protein [Bacteroidota bacterium]